jgi:hypothetical protein
VDSRGDRTARIRRVPVPGLAPRERRTRLATKARNAARPENPIRPLPWCVPKSREAIRPSGRTRPGVVGSPTSPPKLPPNRAAVLRKAPLIRQWPIGAHFVGRALSDFTSACSVALTQLS